MSFDPPPRPTKVSKGFILEDGEDHFTKVRGQSARAKSAKAEQAKLQMQQMAKENMEEYCPGVADPNKPFVGAQPKLLRRPEIASEPEVMCATKVACNALRDRIGKASGVSLVFAEDSQYSEVTRSVLKSAVDEETAMAGAPTTVCLAKDWMSTLPMVEKPVIPPPSQNLLIYVGTPGKYMAMCIRSDRGRFDRAYAEDRLVVLCKSACMLPLGTQEENIFGVDSEIVLDSVVDLLHKKGAIAWGHGAGTKAMYLQRAFGFAAPQQVPIPIDSADEMDENLVHFDYLVEYVKYLNIIKLSQPELRVTNYYDTGLLVSVLMGCITEKGPSLLTDRDGLAMLRDASIGHIISKLNQVVAVKPLCEERAVYNFFIGDGACRLNGGVELALHLIEGYRARSLITLFIFNNHKWAIEDNLVAEDEKEHVLHNRGFYDLLAEHGNVCVCEDDLELRETVAHLSERTRRYLAGQVQPGLNLVVVRGLNMNLPPVLGCIDPILKSAEMAFMREVLGAFAADCKSPVPLYGCSAFEYIQHLHLFLEKMPEGKSYQYVCGRTDVQAAHMCGFEQPEGKCVLFINDVYGVNSLGESLRLVLSGFGGKQLLVMVWHPTLLKVMDHFHLHRPPMVWPSLGPQLMKYYVRSERDAEFFEFESDVKSPVVAQIVDAINSKTPLVAVNIMPEQECNYISLDVRLKTG
eukprot:CAMPEP_0204560024 /NCGR_PEP_ID=MMETSP0661-20131031/32359_1 /ASSEMBLY_ACC=CAM_ASM_000606 /TAXON_ID=109239 /ORGANISM="Alexandrium margalefi, Strain AMGDE01CS-322" /LENGTH=690 /DNA_ID=CAMNT_0051567305 /DNA_START=77 /DNA_END=2149 /DNA_ORIENTATION=+